MILYLRFKKIPQFIPPYTLDLGLHYWILLDIDRLQPFLEMSLKCVS